MSDQPAFEAILRPAGRAEIEQTSQNLSNTEMRALVETYLGNPDYALLQILVPIPVKLLEDADFQTRRELLDSVDLALPKALAGLQLYVQQRRR